MNSSREPEQQNSEAEPSLSHAASPQLRKSDALVGIVLFGEYAILDLLGQGGMAKVYKAKQLSVDRFVALKTLTTNDPDVVARFSHEVKIHGRLHHKNIVQALDCLIDPQTQQSYFVMEYLSGLSIEEMLKRQGPMRSERDLDMIISQICDALDHAHRKGIVHRDLKPGNVILQEVNDELLVKVVDFGIARVQEDMQRFTKTGLVVGSPIYMSPEQCMGTELDSRADVYSMGILLYEILTGTPPYNKGTLMDVMRDHCDPAKFPDPISTAGATIRGDKQLDTILKTALNTDPNQRFQSIEDLKEAMNFWYRSVESEQTDRAVPIPKSSQPVPRTAPNYHSQLRDLVQQKQIAHDPGRRFDETVFCTVLGKGTGEKLRLTNSQISLSDSLIGSVLFNRYKILDLLGEGGMSVVYRALDNTSQQVVAIKTLKYADADLSARFARELEIHGELKHPNIVKAIECLESPGGQSFFVMEYLKGVVLQDYILAQGSIPQFEDICSILSQLLSAIEFAHDQGILHRDIKPDNIILIEQRGQLRVKVLDFGLAKIQEDLQRLTKTGVVVGSPAYMSPEACQGLSMDYPSDIYSLGVVAYEVVTGKLPYSADNEIEIMKAHCDPNCLPMPLSAHRKDIPAGATLEKIFQKALAKNQSKRFESVDDFKQALDDWWQEWNPQSDTLSPFKARKKRKAALKKTVIVTEKSAKEVQALTDLMDVHRKSQEQSFRSHFEAKEAPFDYKRLVKPAITVAVLVTALGAAWGVSVAVEKMMAEKKAQEASRPAGGSGPGTGSGTGSGTASETATGTGAGTESGARTSASADGEGNASDEEGNQNTKEATKLSPLLNRFLAKPASSEIPVDDSAPAEEETPAPSTSRGGGTIRGLNFQRNR